MQPSVLQCTDLSVDLRSADVFLVTKLLEICKSVDSNRRCNIAVHLTLAQTEVGPFFSTCDGNRSSNLLPRAVVLEVNDAEQACTNASVT